MSQTLTLSNFSELNVIEKSVLSADVPVGANTLPMSNPQNYAAGDFIVIGTLGSETSELAVVSSVTDTTIVLTAPLIRAHFLNDGVTKLFGNQLKVYRAPNVDGTQPASTAFTALGTTPIDTDQPTTSYTDAAGSEAYWYAYTFYNSTSSTETSVSDSKSSRGGGVGDYVGIDLIRRAAGFENNSHIDDPLVDTFRQAAQDTINGALSGRYTLPFKRPINAHIADLTKRIAASRLRLEQLPGNASAQKMYDEAMLELKDLQEGNATLTGETGVSDTVASSANGGPGFGGWPNSSTEAAGGGGKRFSVTDRY